MKLAVAREKQKVSKQVYLDYVSMVMNTRDDTNWPELDRLAKIANDAERQLDRARDDALNDSLIHGPLEETTEVVMVEDETEIPFGYRVPRKGE